MILLKLYNFHPKYNIKYKTYLKYKITHKNLLYYYFSKYLCGTNNINFFASKTYSKSINKCFGIYQRLHTIFWQAWIKFEGQGPISL